MDQVLLSAPWIDGLFGDELVRAREGLSVRLFPKGAYICHVGDQFDYWVGVDQGLVKVSAVSESGRPITFTGVSAGGWFGEGSLLKRERRRYDIVTLCETRLAMLKSATFFWLLNNSRAFNTFLIRQLNERLGQFVGGVEYQASLTPTARVARSLYWLLHPVLHPKAANHIDITQDELAVLSGLSRYATNRSLRILAKQGLLVQERERIIVSDLDRLARYQ